MEAVDPPQRVILISESAEHLFELGPAEEMYHAA